jgi:hypothetical protein
MRVQADVHREPLHKGYYFLPLPQPRNKVQILQQRNRRPHAHVTVWNEIQQKQHAKRMKSRSLRVTSRQFIKSGSSWMRKASAKSTVNMGSVWSTESPGSSGIGTRPRTSRLEPLRRPEPISWMDFRSAKSRVARHTYQRRARPNLYGQATPPSRLGGLLYGTAGRRDGG